MRYLVLLAFVVGCGVEAESFGGGGYGGARMRGAVGGDAGAASTGGVAGGSAGGSVGSGGDSGGGAGGAPGAGGAGGASTPPPACASGKFWRETDPNDGTHRPGSSCTTCHVTFTLSGTVYATPRELTDCFGVDGVDKLSIQITQANLSGRSLKVNAVGNFWTTVPIVFPVTVSVSGPDGGRYMQAPVASGDCNGCHTATDAGRILPPS